MRTLGLVALVVGVLVAAAVVSPWVAWGVAAAVGRSFTFARVFERTFEVLLVGALAVTWRRLDLGRAGDLGLHRRGAGRALVAGAAVGAAGLAVGLGLVWFAGALHPALRYPPEKTLHKALLGAGAALVLGAGEEALFRGLVLRRVARDAGTAVGIAVTTALYAAVHVVRTGGVAGPIGPWSGVEHLAALFVPLSRPAARPPLVGLALLGLLLAAARLRSGSLWVPIGIHVAWVAVFRVGRLFFTLGPTPAWIVGAGWPPLVGGAAAWLAVGVSAAVLPALVRRRARQDV